MRPVSLFDFAIIGAGVSGGKIAEELVNGGARCILLEAGRDFDRSTFPSSELDYSSQLFWGGGVELSDDGRMGFLRAKCVGGTSVVNQALLDRFDDLAWYSWRSRSGVNFFNSVDMAKHYDASEAGLSISEIPWRHFNRNAKTFVRAFEKNKLGWKPLRRGQQDCKIEKGTDCIACLGGCVRDSKQSALVTSIRRARENGLTVEPNFEVAHLIHEKDRVKIFGRQAGKLVEVFARKAVLAAGALGNSGILLRSGLRSRLPALGTGFCCHPQYMTYAVFDEPVDAHKGAFQAVKSDDRKLREKGFKIENVFAPPIGTAMLLPGLGRSHLRLMKKYRYMASMEIAIQDEPEGRIDMQSNGQLKISKPLTSQDRRRLRNGLELVQSLFVSIGAREVVPCEQAFGLHLMGGCAIGTDSKTSVVRPDFKIHGHANLYAADSSIFPAAPGINPSLTIMAFAHRASQQMLAA